MARKYEKEFKHFLSEVKLIKDAEKAKYALSDEMWNIITFSGEVIGEDTREEINSIGRKYGFQVLAEGLSVIYRSPKSYFTIS